MSISRYIFVILCVILVSGIISQINAEQIQIPNWMRNNANWWYKGQISDSEFIKGIQFLIGNKIMIIPTSNVTINKEDKIPSWVKNNAGWWANGTISDNDFISDIQYLVSSGIIVINSNSTQINSDQRCAIFTTDAEKETCLEQLQYAEKI